MNLYQSDWSCSLHYPQNQAYALLDSLNQSRKRNTVLNDLVRTKNAPRHLAIVSSEFAFTNPHIRNGSFRASGGRDMICDAETNEYVATGDEESEQKADSEEVLFELLKLLGVII